ncbi:MAG: hypothetical protein COS95_06405 [Ignavibacteriales bacterium CG07_land_8_20_14_0_80_59_12]|nr:MAG: hypothetical protein COS95_06405 [Ignavibacteriales bacterium CG07_land_8_20_14_0_80_59_12]
MRVLAAGLVLLVPVCIIGSGGGCGMLEEETLTYDSLPELVDYTPISFPREAVGFRESERLRVRMHVTRDGEIDHIEPLFSTGNDAFVRIAIESIRLWRFSPARLGGKPVGVWVIQTFVVRLEAPSVHTIREILVSNKALADSLFVLLRAGAPFDSLARACSEAPSAPDGGLMRRIQLDVLPVGCRAAVRALKPGEVTSPLQRQEGWALYCLVE